MRRCLSILLGIVSIALIDATTLFAQPAFVNGIVIRGDRLDATRQPGANGGRFGFFSDIYYDPATDEWWALSDRGPGGGLISYGTRVQRFSIDVNPFTGAISHFRVLETVKFTDPKELLTGTSKALNGLNPLDLNGFEGTLGRSFDPEGLVIDPRTGNFLVADEYGPSLYAFDRKGRLARVFETPINLIPRAGGNVNYVALRDACGGSVPVPAVRRKRGATGQSRLRRARDFAGRFAAVCRAPGSADQRARTQQRAHRSQRPHHRLRQRSPQPDVRRKPRAVRLSAGTAGRRRCADQRAQARGCDAHRSATGPQHRCLGDSRHQRHGVPGARTRQPRHRRRRPWRRASGRQQARLQDQHHRRD